MRVTGFCERCRRVRPVKVTGHGWAMRVARGMATGVCQRCEDEEAKKRGAR